MFASSWAPSRNSAGQPTAGQSSQEVLYGCIGVFRLTSKSALPSSPPGKLTYMDHMRGSLASSFLLGLVDGTTPTRHEKKGGGECSLGIYHVGSGPVESTQAEPNPNLSFHCSQSAQLPLSWAPGTTPYLAFLGLQKVRSPDILALGLCTTPVGSLPPANTFAQVLVRFPQID